MTCCSVWTPGESVLAKKTKQKHVYYCTYVLLWHGCPTMCSLVKDQSVSVELWHVLKRNDGGAGLVKSCRFVSCHCIVSSSLGALTSTTSSSPAGLRVDWHWLVVFGFQSVQTAMVFSSANERTSCSLHGNLRGMQHWYDLWFQLGHKWQAFLIDTSAQSASLDPELVSPARLVKLWSPKQTGHLLCVDATVI